MRLGLRIFAVYFLFVGLSAWFVFGTVMGEIRPGVRQSTEETLVDTANLLAELLREDLLAGTLTEGRLGALLAAYGQRRPGAEIWGVRKQGVSHRIYVTDARGIVLLDSTGRDTGADYSRWNDVHLTLQGRYGARSTPETVDGVESSVMYVGAPIRDGERIVGVVTVAKPSQSLQPYIERSQRRLAWIGAGFVVAGLAVGALLSWWLGRRLQRLTRWADAVSAGERGVAAPPAGNDELGRLARALTSMREQLEGKAYVERYVQALTHELKSPLSAIRGAAELLGDPLDAPDRQRFAGSVAGEAERMQALVERLLDLARLEQRKVLERRERVVLVALAAELLAQRELRARQRGVRIETGIAGDLAVHADRLLLGQALGNLLDNALDFTPAGGAVRIDARHDESGVCIRVRNDGAPIPDYALARLGERFFSLPRPDTGRKSTGLGLAFCREVAALHGGRLEIGNVAGGVEATLELPDAG
jgi:two-component system sensor histidine kinase CreC